MYFAHLISGAKSVAGPGVNGKIVSCDGHIRTLSIGCYLDYPEVRAFAANRLLVILVDYSKNAEQ